MSESHLREIFAAWPQGQGDLVEIVKGLKAHALAKPGAQWGLVSRPGVSHSLRFSLAGGARAVFLLVDAAYLSADLLTLSVCFYADQVGDPEDSGEVIPLGLLGEDGYCFTVDEDEPGLLPYLQNRVDEAFVAAEAEKAGDRG